MKAIELRGVIDENRQLRLDEPLPITETGRVRVIILVPEQGDDHDAEWLRAATANPAFDFLRDPQEEVYTLADGKPFRDEE